MKTRVKATDRPHGMCPGQKSKFTKDGFTYLSIEWNSIRLGGLAHGKNHSANCAQNILQYDKENTRNSIQFHLIDKWLGAHTPYFLLFHQYF